MQTEILSEKNADPVELASRVREIWLSGGLVAFPTETVYGLGGNGLDPEASKKIYAAKGRPSDNPLILHIGMRTQLYPLVKEVPEKAEKLMDAFWPGPLTIIFKKADIVPYETSGGLDTVAVRMPSHPLANRLLINAGCPVAAPSANLSGRPSTTSFQHVKEDMDGRIDAIVDGGDVEIGVESTIIDMTGEIPTLLRPGYITVADLEKVIGPVETDPAIRNESIISKNTVARPKAPGMKYRHYAPKAALTVVYGEMEDQIEAIRKASDDRTGIITVDENLACYRTGKALSLGTRKDPDSIAHNLFAVLRAFDSLNVDRIYSEDFTETDIGTAVMNRLLKAAGGSFKNAKELLKEKEL